MKPTILPNGVRLRDLHDPETTRQDILDRVRNGYLAKFPIDNGHVKIELLDADYDQKKLFNGLAATKKALLEGGRLAVPLHGTFRLSDSKTGDLLEERKSLIANVPYMTDRGTFVNGGIEYSVMGQHRLRAGVFARRKENGETESHVNTKSGTGPQMRLFMEPSTGVYRVKLNQANIKLYPILSALGVKDEELAKQWGPGILEANQKAADKLAVDKFHEKLMGSKYDPLGDPLLKPAQIAEKLATMELDPDTTSRTLGAPYSNVSPEVLVKSTAKLLRLHRGEEQGDDRDSLVMKSFHSVDDFMEERVRKDAGGLARNLAYKAGYDRTLKALRPGYFTPQLDDLIVGNSLSMPISGINSMEFRDSSSRISPMGESGIGSMESVPMSSRGVHPSHLSFIDPIRSSESRAIGLDARISHAVRKGDDQQLYAPWRNRRTGEVEWKNPSDLWGKTLSFAPSTSVTL